MKELRLGVFGPGDVGKSACIKWMVGEFKRLKKNSLVVDTDPHNSLSIDLSDENKLLRPWSSKEVRVGLKTLVGDASWRDIALMSSPTRLGLKDLSNDLIQETSWGGIIRTYPLDGTPDPGCDHARLNPLQSILSAIELPENWVLLIDHPGGERALSWAWGALPINFALIIYHPNNAKHEREVEILESYCEQYNLPSLKFSVDNPNVLIREGVMEADEHIFNSLYSSIVKYLSTDEQRLKRNSSFELR